MATSSEEHDSRFRVLCVGCEREILARDDWVGQEVRCPHCHTAMRVPQRPPGNRTAHAIRLPPRDATTARFSFSCPRCDSLLESSFERIGEPESPPRTEQAPLPSARITAVKRFANVDLIREYATGGDDPERQALCSFCKEGDTFVSKGMTKPEGFCSWAWADIQRDVVWACLGGVQAKHKTPGTAITCCTDGLNPVVFHIERIEEEVTG